MLLACHQSLFLHQTCAFFGRLGFVGLGGGVDLGECLQEALVELRLRIEARLMMWISMGEVMFRSDTCLDLLDEFIALPLAAGHEGACCVLTMTLGFELLVEFPQSELLRFDVTKCTRR